MQLLQTALCQHQERSDLRRADQVMQHG
jgi:hypothetical protein